MRSSAVLLALVLVLCLTQMALPRSPFVVLGGMSAALAIRVLPALFVSTRAGVPGWLASLGSVLPPAERANWLAVVASVLHAETDPRQRRRQAVGFVLSLPTTAVTSWWLASRRVRELG